MSYSQLKDDTVPRTRNKTGPKSPHIDGKGAEFREGFSAGYMKGYAAGRVRNEIGKLQKEIDGLKKVNELLRKL